ncbi:MAG: glycoside hydrolase family 127 protein [Clostridia bacterium]|nr:glycoside hydrolase family 127 protein [Clostridia bacterium]
MSFQHEGLFQNVLQARGIMDDAVRFVTECQLKDRELWLRFAEVFETKEDSELGRWRGEYFGKQMRGAALVYAYTQDEELYGVMTDTVLSLLEKQDELGRFSTYKVEEEFRGWDMWCRKYVLVGMLYYYEVCKDEALKEKILSACRKHLDYILEKVGGDEGKIAITATSHWWGCVNSCTILEPTVEMYKKTGEQRYLDFAEYIVSTGGCSDCNLVELALEGELSPYQYPVTKAYEMMSFYEGLLAYYEVTGERKCFDAVCRFIEAVAKTDITIIGCAGCTHELFDNSVAMQTEYHENIMQETCVTVTWMRVLRRLYQLTKDTKYIDRFEVSAYNALYGSLNTELNEQLCMETGKYCKAMAFDSYSPLYMNTRGRGIGGYNEFASGGYYGCCLAIGACGVALPPLTAVMQGDDGVYVNGLFEGTAKVKDDDGKDVTLHFDSKYPANGDGKITVECENSCRLTLKIRKPDWCEDMTVNGVCANEGYYTLTATYQSGECVEISMKITLKARRLNGKIAFTYGALTLATDEQKSARELQKTVAVNEPLTYRVLPSAQGELLRVECDLADGDKLILADYQSCGKKWLSDKPLMTVWFNGEEK